MRGAVWAVVLSLVFGLAGSASSFSGRWKTELDLDIDPTAAFADSFSLWSEVASEFQIGSWTFANTTFFDSEAGLHLTRFAVEGALGAFGMISSTAFAESFGADRTVLAGRVSVGGVEFWGGTTLWRYTAGDSGAGLIFGASGIAGGSSIYADMAFNIERPIIWRVIEMGFDAVWEQLLLCDLLGPAAVTCDLPFSFLNVHTNSPLGCFDIETLTTFWWVDGFHLFRAWISDVDLGFGGLTLNRVDLLFAIDSKALLLDFGLRLAEAVCITPYVTWVEDASIGLIDGFSVRALEMICEVGGVKVIVSELFGAPVPGPLLGPIFLIGNDARIHRIDLNFRGFSMCFEPVDADEAIGVEFERAGCCGGTFKLGIYAFFDTDLPGTSLFDWSETRARFEYATASNLTVSGYLDVFEDGIPWLGVAFELLWGDLVLFGPDWQAACCRMVF